MIISTSGSAKIQHNITKQIFIIEIDELEWDLVTSDERQMGQYVQYEAQVEHEDLGILKWELHEYPLGVQDYRNTDVGEHHLIRDLNYKLTNEPNFDDWVDYQASDDPYTIFIDTYHHTNDLLADIGGENGDHLVNRMIFSQMVAALEAFLSDTLVNAVLADKEVITKLLAVNKDLKEQKFTLSDINADSDIVAKHVQKYLRQILYHNLSKVSYLYNAALGVELLDKTIDKEKLYKAIQFRHDCVHRNGRTSSGEKLEIFTKSYITDIADEFHMIVKRIQRQL